jgi:hypothetical protein
MLLSILIGFFVGVAFPAAELVGAFIIGIVECSLIFWYFYNGYKYAKEMQREDKEIMKEDDPYSDIKEKEES